MGSQKKVLVIGGGGREHAIAEALQRSPHVSNVYVTPGNAGTDNALKVSNVSLKVDDFDSLIDWCKLEDIDLVVVGPELPLSRGISDALTKNGIDCFGPCRDAAKIESSKYYAKVFMDKFEIPTAKWKNFSDSDEAKSFIDSANFNALVIKADGLAGGKGVIVAANAQQAKLAVDEITKSLGEAARKIIIEETLDGDEVSVLAFTDGKSVCLMPPSQDHKRLLENDEGPNTGGMGAYCPVPFLSNEELNQLVDLIFLPTIRGLAKEGAKYVGVLYAGLMLTPDGPKVLEFNCRFGDPETQVVLPLLESDLFLIMKACVNGSLDQVEVKWSKNTYCVGTIVASSEYPKSGSKGQIIKGFETMNDDKVTVIHAGTINVDNKILTNGGRVLTIVAKNENLETACRLSRLSAALDWFDGQRFRKDIGQSGICRKRMNIGKLTYESSGVNIKAGDNLVEDIKQITGTVNISGLVGGVGGFASIFDPSKSGLKDPLIVTSTDGVGTKLMIAHELKKHDTVGFDLVAMCVNDILTHGAKPVVFLDYLATGNLDVDVARDVVKSIELGCRQSGCALVGGETAELPGMIRGSVYDVAGFSVGLVERQRLLPKLDLMLEGDVLIGLPSNGIHSNGFSLVRNIISSNNWCLSDPAPFSESNQTLGMELLTPTRIYVKDVLDLMDIGLIKGAAHITGGGITGNLARVLPNNLTAQVEFSRWKIPSVFGWLATEGGVDWQEMLKTFNLGIGFVMIVEKNNVDTILNLLQSNGAFGGGHIIGQLVSATSKTLQSSGSVINRCHIKDLPESLWKSMRKFVRIQRPFLFNRKRVAVLISGTGTNLRSLIRATMDSYSVPSAEIAFVISNVPNVGGLDIAKDSGIPHAVINHKDFQTRQDFDKRVHEEILKYNIDLICLAGFMRILSSWFVKQWTGKMINIHPSLLPSFKGLHTHRQVLKAGAKYTGSTVHFVVDELDSGEIIAQTVIPVEDGDTEDSLQERVKQVEHQLYPKALEMVASGRIKFQSA